ncbi:MAG: sigma-54 interaction domain-containing protein, partial [Planctomycetota bacterium]
KRGGLKGDYSAIVGSSPCMLEIFRVLDRISNSNAPVLIAGESGTGKELIAHAVHDNSPRRGKVFVSENCGALTETLLESELFGYVKGAFTGATKDSKGLFELAEGGTLFLDEVGDMSPGMQKKLLRVLQEGVIRRVGGKEYIPVDVRVISATNKDLLEEVRAGNFREDLYYRLNVITIRVPSLRERKEDIPELVENFLEEVAKETGVRKRIEPAAVQRLAQYNWPGNVRELKNEIRRLHALAEGDIGLHDLSETILAGEDRDRPFHALGTEIYQLTLKDATERLEREMIRNAIIQARGNKSLVAKMLQVPKTSLYTKINKYGLDKL